MIIYKTTNLINSKIYIGYDTKNRPDYYGSGRLYKLAENKHGKENFRKTVIDSSDNFEELCLKEKFWISFYDARNPRVGYNVLPGGEGGWPDLSGSRHSRYGKHCSDDTKSKMRIKMLGRKRPDVSENNKARTGTKHPMYGKKRLDISEMNKSRWTNYRKTKEKRNGPV